MIKSYTIIQRTYPTPKHLGSSELVESIVGREEELKTLAKQLQENSALLLVNGIGGVGKSTLASYYLYTQKEDLAYYGFFDGIDGFTNTLIKKFALPADSQLEHVIVELERLQGSKLFVIDDVKNVSDYEKEITLIKSLKESHYQILFTSRENMEGIANLELEVLNLEDAKKLFRKQCGVSSEDEKLLETILNYLDCHTLFVEMTAKALKAKSSLTLEKLYTKFKEGEFTQVSIKRKESFNDYLEERFSLDALDEEQVLLLKQLSALPSIAIPLETLQSYLKYEELETLEEILNELSELGWLSKVEESYKLHQIIKEFIHSFHLPSYEEIEKIVNIFSNMVPDDADIQTALQVREDLHFFESLNQLLNKQNVEDEEVARFLIVLGFTYNNLGMYLKAEPLFIKGSRMSEKLFGEEHPNTAKSYDNLGDLYRSMGAYEKAELLHEKALNIHKTILGEEHPSTVTSYAHLATLYALTGAYEKAEPLYEKSLKLCKKLLGEEHPNTASSYNNLGDLYRSMRAYEKAEPLYEKALKLRQKLLGEEHPNTASSYNNLALLYKSMGAYEKAEPLYEKALKLREKLLGEEHPDTATSYNNLAGLYEKLEKYEESLKLHQKALTIRQMTLGEIHPSTAQSYWWIGTIFLRNQDFQEAYNYIKQAKSIYEEILPVDHPTLKNINTWYKDVKNALEN